MPKDYPDHHDAELVLKLYELRREPVMRESRTAINRNFWPKTFADIQAVMQPEHPLNAPYRQTATYWEMVYGMARHGIIHADFLLENNGEGLFLYAKTMPYLKELRQLGGPRVFQNADWVATHSDVGRQVLEMFRTRVEKALATK